MTPGPSPLQVVLVLAVLLCAPTLIRWGWRWHARRLAMTELQRSAMDLPAMERRRMHRRTA